VNNSAVRILWESQLGGVGTRLKMTCTSRSLHTTHAGNIPDARG